jgi:hypothetical protein
MSPIHPHRMFCWQLLEKVKSIASRRQFCCSIYCFFFIVRKSSALAYHDIRGGSSMAAEKDCFSIVIGSSSLDHRAGHGRFVPRIVDASV